jgi:hypothetical protein
VSTGVLNFFVQALVNEASLSRPSSMNGGAPLSMIISTPCSASSEAKRSYSGIELRNSSLLPALKFSNRGTTPMPSGRMRISSSSVPGRRVGLTIPTTPRHSVKLMVAPARRPL